MLENVPFYHILKDSIRVFWHRRQRIKLSNTEIIEKRQKWKPLFEEYILDHKRANSRNDVIVRDLERLDNYPYEDKQKRGISAWFKVGLLETYHRGVMVGLHWEALSYLPQKGVWVFSDQERDPKYITETLILCGYIPFECISNVDWEGDEYYQTPHIYCHFAAKKRQPYEAFGFCREIAMSGSDMTVFIEVDGLKAVQKASKKHRRKSVHFR